MIVPTQIGGSMLFGVAKGLRFAGGLWKAKNISKYPKGDKRGMAGYHKRALGT